MRLIQRVLALYFALIMTSSLFAQVSVSGMVTDDSGNALSGANVYLAGTITASAGLIGGWQINPSPVEIRSPNERLVLSAVASAERITVKDTDDDAVIKIFCTR